MSAPFVFLTVRSLKNRVVRRLRRLREPRYLAGLIAGLAYLYVFVIRNQMKASRETPADLLQFSSYGADIVAGGALLLWLGLLLVWLWPFPSQPWAFTAAEVHFFFTAPVMRRRLLDYKLLRSQLGVLFTVLMIAFFSGAMRAAAAGRWSFVLGGWLFFVLLQLHFRGAMLTKLAFRAPAAKVPPLAWLSAAAMVAASGLLIGALAVRAPVWLAQSPAEAMRTVLDGSQRGVAWLALWPFAAMVRPIFALGLSAFLAALLPAVALLALHYWWVVSSDANFEEAALAAERRQSQKRSAAPPRPIPVPFKLEARGGPEAAILWKNTILLGRYFSIGLIVRVLVPLVVVAVLVGLQTSGSKVAPLLGMLVVFMTLVGPYMIRNDLRHDMPRLPVLKTWPVSGRQLLVGELLGPLVALTVLVWFLLALTLALAPPAGRFPLDAAGRVTLGAGVALVAPLMIAGQLLIQNAAVVLFPGWIATGSARARGIEAMGQNMLMFAGTLLALVVGLIPAALVSGGLGYLLYQVVGWAAAAPAAVVMAAILGAEVAIVIGWLGRLLERTEPSQVEAGE